MRYCKTKIYAMPVPSLNDVNQIKIEKVMDKIGNVIEEEDLAAMINTIEKQINESDYTAMDIAAAFLKLYMGQLSEGNDTSVEYTFDNTGAEEGGHGAPLINMARRRRSRQRTSWARSRARPISPAS